MGLTQKIILSCDAHITTPVLYSVYGDTGRFLEMTFKDYTLPTSPAPTAAVNIARPNGTFYQIPATVSGQKVTCEEDQMLTELGETFCGLEVTDSSGTVTSFPFVVRVLPNQGGAPTPEQSISIAELKREIEQKQDSLAGYAEATLQTGTSTAGAKGWYIKEWVDAGDAEYLYLCNADGTFPDMELFSVGDILSCKAGFSANYCWEITHLEPLSEDEWMMIVTRTDNFLMLAQGAPFAPEDHLYGSDAPGYVWNPERPSIGDVPIGYGAMAIGYENRANEMGSLVIGADNIVDGRYAFANGQDNVVAYGSAAIGHENKVLGYDSIAAGRKNKTGNWNTSAFGSNNEVNAPDGFVSGRGNTATKNAHAGVNIRGTFAKEQVNDTYVDVVGIGTSPTNRVNGLALSKDGNFRIRGEILARCNPDSSGGTNLLTTIAGKEDKGTYTLIDESTVTQDESGDIWLYLSRPCRCVMVWISFPRAVAENFRVYANAALNQSGGQIAVTAGSSGVCNAKFKFDATHGILESEWAKQEGLGGYVGKTTYAGFENEPVVADKIESVIIRNISNGIIRQGTKIKIYGF